ncbi:hypothetical protein Tco_1081201 [Tanacetum coccineum]|uniref:Zinc finger, CCHC-type n=1 Tax=Tanacetum coccineum TaxID=301880 RepID=A0ABQ5HWU7_9ASTR
MTTAALKHMASGFAKLEKFEGVDFRRWQKKMHFMLSSMSVVYVLTTSMPDDGGENPTIEQDATSKKFLVSNFTNYKMTDYNELLGILGRFKQHNMNMDESIKVSCIIGIPIDSDHDKPKGNNVAGPLVVNMVEHNNSSRYNDNKGKCKHHDTRANPNKKPKVTYWKCGKPGYLKKDCKAGNVGNRANGLSTKGSEDGSSNPLKGQNRCWFKTYESLNDGSILHMGNESTALVHGRGCVKMTNDPIWGCDRLVSRAKVIENQVMDFSVISISSDSSEESVRTSTARVILFGTILTTISSTAPTTDLPAIHDDTPLIHLLFHAFDTPNTPSSQNPYEVIVARWRSRVAVRSSPPSPPIR